MEATAEPGHASSQQCSSCDESSARCWCVDCNEALCDACVSAHRRVTLTRSHRILNQPPAGEVSTPPTKFCRLHPSEPLKLFCFTCNQLTCRDCQLMAHMNHRYQFVREGLDDLKKQLEDWLQPITAQRDTVRRSLLDMENRLRDIAESESHLKAELLQSYYHICKVLKQRMEELLKETKTVCQTETEMIQRRMQRLKRLQLSHQSVTDTAHKARNTTDMLSLLSYRAQIESQLKSLSDQNSSPPQTMSQLMVVTDRTSLEALLKFGSLKVSWVPFSVSQTSNQNRDSSPTCPAPSRLPQTKPTVDSPVPALCPSTSTSSSTQSRPSSCLSVVQSDAVLSSAPAAVGHLSCPAKMSPQGNLQQNPTQTVSTSVNLQFVSVPPPYMILNVVQPSQAVNQQTPQNRTATAAILLNNNQTVYQVFPMTLKQSASCIVLQQKNNGMSKTLPATSSTCKPLPLTESTNHVSSWKSLSIQVCPPPSSSSSSSTVTPPTYIYRPLPLTESTNHRSSPVPDDLTASLQTSDHSRPQLLCDITSSSLKQQQQQQGAVVRAVADSACDHGVQQATAQRQEPAEDEPTSTVSEDTEPAGRPSQQPSSVIGRPDCKLSQWQPRVSLFRLPVTPPPLGRPLPRFSLVCDGDEDHVKMMSEDAQSHADDITDDITEPLSSPESPVTLQMVTCSACGSAFASIVCSACGRGFHRDCHVPPVGPDIWSEWICSLCQDPADPFSCDRAHRGCLSVCEQRKCESLLLHLKVEACHHLIHRPEFESVASHLRLMSERLTLHHQPSYQTAADVVSDIWSLFRDAAQVDDDDDDDDDDVKKLQQSFQSRLKETFRSELHPSVLTPPSRNNDRLTQPCRRSKVTADKQEVTFSNMRKRLGEFLVGKSESKRMRMEEKTPPPSQSHDQT